MTGNGHAIPGTPIAVDVWNLHNHPEARVFFLSHFHSDHVVGLNSSWEYPIYTSEITKKLIVQKLKIQPYLIQVLSVGEEHLIPLDYINKEMLSVTIYDANHCPGSIMFLFQGYFGNILYTGDFRFSPGLMTSLKLPVIDVLYLDNTYCSPKCEFSTREDAVEAILHRLHDCLHTSKRVFLGLDNLGKEELLQKIFEETHSKICVDGARAETLKLLGCGSDLITTDSSNAKVIVVSTNKITVTNMSKWNSEMTSCAILPTARFCGFDMKPYSRHSNIHIIPYSNHSSFKELEIFVKHVWPRSIVPVVGRHVKGLFGIDRSQRSNMNVFNHLLNKLPRPDFTIPVSVRLTMKSRCIKTLPKKRKKSHRNKMEVQKKRKLYKIPKGVKFENDDLSSKTVLTTVGDQFTVTEASQAQTKSQTVCEMCGKENVWEISVLTRKQNSIIV